MRIYRLVICLLALVNTAGCGGSGGGETLIPGTSFTPPSGSSIMLPPPTNDQQVDQPDSPTCAPAVGTTLYRVITGKSYSFDQTITEMNTDLNGTLISVFIDWLNNHEMKASKTELPTSLAIDMIVAQIKTGHYVVPYVNEDALPNEPHVFIVYGVDNNRVLISDSNEHFGMHRLAIDTTIFLSDWLINLGTKDAPSCMLIFIDNHPRVGTATGFYSGSYKMTHGDLLVRRASR